MSPDVDVGVLIVRLIGGGIFLAHGLQKAFGLWGGAGPSGWRRTLSGMGLRPVNVWWVASVGAEVGGGVGLILGALTPLAAAALVGHALVIIFRVQWRNGFWNRGPGVEFPLALSMAPLAVVLIGPGSISVDHVIGLELPLGARLGLAAVAVITALSSFAFRPPATPSDTASARGSAR